jgi:pantetheine-phosphate adenylyltransferase
MPESTVRSAVYVGSFDPPTLGHLDVIQRGSALFDRLIVGIGINPDKQPLFTAEERVQLVGQMTSRLPNVEVRSFYGLSVSFAKDCEAGVFLRGVRTVSDIELEFTMALTNHTLAPSIETVFLMSSEKYSHISSTLIKQIAKMARNNAEDSLAAFVPDCVIRPLVEKFRD